MKPILLSLSVCIILISCTTQGAASKIVEKPENYVVLLDLSDRLVNVTQTDIDTSMIRACFERFEAAVQKNLIVKSKDKFCIRILPQKDSHLPINNFENNLTIDLGALKAAEKLKKLNDFRGSLGNNLKMLYLQAYQGAQTNAYQGVDIWQYFNEQIINDISEQYHNKIVVLTDGYFDFEDPNRGLNNSHQSSVTKPLLAQMRSENWIQEAEQNNIGIIPVKLPSQTQFLIAGIQPKTNDILEAQKLSYLWEKWIRQSGGISIRIPIVNASSGKMKSLMKLSL